ncbi:hypothetical protein Dsin_026058 [Dipteronia sinensis]|uniref:Uncharacterized protein n=1 Tax=Dipteronia sinensis TaxID=43782 RepID=A0AAE0DXP3_9ROSI|nr:hypothetical protein Dsin_026058 [Dipteronia sinensis]
MATMPSSMLKTNPLLLSSKPRVNFTESSRFASVKVEGFVNFTSISTSQNTVRGHPFNFEARFKTPSSRGNTFEQAAVIPEEKDMRRTRVIKLQVGLHLRGPSFEENINQIAETADTSNSSGLIYILQETTEALLNHSMSWIAVNSSVKVSESIADAEKYFRRLSIEEQEKFDRLTLVNMDNIKSENLHDQKANTMSRNTHMVVTILVAAKGKTVLKFPSTIDSNEDLKKALKVLQTISESAEIQAVNVLWSPQDGNEVMSCEELYEEYPLLCRIGGGDYS